MNARAHRFEFRVVDLDGKDQGGVGDFETLDDADATRVHWDNRYPDYAPHRVQIREVTPWQDVVTPPLSLRVQ